MKRVSMDTSNDSDAIMNLKLLRRIYYYRLIDPNGQNIFGYNINRLLFAVIMAINYTLTVYSNMGFFFNVDYTLNYADFLLIIFVDMEVVLMFFKICLFFYRVDKLTYLLDVDRVEFFTSKLCRKNNKILYGYRNAIKKYTETYYIWVTVVASQWILFPLMNNIFFADGNVNSNTRNPNILNMPFPISTHTYNQYYVVFFVTEMLFVIFFLYCSNLLDILLFSYGWIVSFQYEVLCLGFKDLGYGNTQSIENDNDRMDVTNDLKILLSDQNKLFLKFKSFNEFSRSIVLTHVVITSSSIIILTFTLILIYSSLELISILQLVKIVSADIYLSLQLYFYCQLFDNLDHKRDSVNFSMYSSNWTNKDLKSKKLLLLAMRMNNANRFQMKASPQRIINLQLFSSVMINCYNIISVMVKTLRKKN